MLAHTKAVRLAYVGFSQGTAQAFAGLSLCPSLNDRISVFAALSPALAVRGLARSPLTALVESDVTLLYALFGVRAMLPQAIGVQGALSGRAWALMLEGALLYLFGCE